MNEPQWTSTGYTQITEKQAQEQAREVQALQAQRGQAFVEKWEYKTKEQLDHEDPSLREGLDRAKLKLWRRQVVRMLSGAGQNLKMCAAFGLRAPCLARPCTSTAHA
jgi:hypothetical protein